MGAVTVNPRAIGSGCRTSNVITGWSCAGPDNSGPGNDQHYVVCACMQVCRCVCVCVGMCVYMYVCVYVCLQGYSGADEQVFL